MNQDESSLCDVDCLIEFDPAIVDSWDGTNEMNEEIEEEGRRRDLMEIDEKLGTGEMESVVVNFKTSDLFSGIIASAQKTNLKAAATNTESNGRISIGP
ncbi:hypothetical protein F2Q70_00039069 [Brassica cretica]|uniref:Uncharacterized protein n=1 Tax=Brassica cretica TaxID=69181 RepID=A0A8S9KAB3_BRACR|nr:hypothetical protein F2Q70_00039069 [Brassica cretica]